MTFLLVVVGLGLAMSAGAFVVAVAVDVAAAVAIVMVAVVRALVLVVGASVLVVHDFSSDPSLQSESPSQSQLAGMQFPIDGLPVAQLKNPSRQSSVDVVEVTVTEVVVVVVVVVEVAVLEVVVVVLVVVDVVVVVELVTVVAVIVVEVVTVVLVTVVTVSVVAVFEVVVSVVVDVCDDVVFDVVVFVVAVFVVLEIVDVVEEVDVEVEVVVVDVPGTHCPCRHRQTSKPAITCSSMHPRWPVLAAQKVSAHFLPCFTFWFHTQPFSAHSSSPSKLMQANMVVVVDMVVVDVVNGWQGAHSGTDIDRRPKSSPTMLLIKSRWVPTCE